MNPSIRARLLALIPVLFGMTLMVFLVMRLVPGDPASAMLGPAVDVEQVPQLQVELGLDRPWPIQYLVWLGDILSGDLGRSVSLSQPVADVVLAALGPTLLLVGSALVIGSLIGAVAGLAAARHRRSAADRALGLLLLLGISTPPVLLGLLFVQILAVWLGWLPVSGMLSAFGEGGALDLLSHLILPVMSLALVTGAVIARVVRSAAVDAVEQEPIALMRARGIGEQRIFRSHILRRVRNRFVPLVGSQTGFLIGGVVYIETIFEWPGLGRQLVDAAAAGDMPLLQGGVLVISLIYIFVILLADLTGLWLNRRTTNR